jgi:hypothetical protein
MAKMLMIGSVCVFSLSLSAPAQAASGYGFAFPEFVREFMTMFSGSAFGGQVSALAQAGPQNAQLPGESGGGEHKKP